MTPPSPARRFVLPPDAELLPVARLPFAVRATLACDDASWVLTRPSARAPTRVLGAQGAALVASFREPRTFADAVDEWRRVTGAEGSRCVDAAATLVAALVARELLADADSASVGAVTPSLRRGARVRGFTVRACLRALSDSEVYEVRAPAGVTAVLKIARAPGPSPVDAALRREAALLRAGEPSGVLPRLLMSGRHARRRFLVTEWRAGRDLASAAARRRALPPPERERALLALACAVLDAFAALHARGIVHGDVNGGNVLVDDAGRATVIDLGQAIAADSPGDGAVRAGVVRLYEPELALAEGTASPPPASLPGEQYALAALLYTVFTGREYLRFAAERAAALRQIVLDPPLPFTRRGVAAWPAVERVLSRALSKRPEDRFSSVAEFARRLHEAAPPPAAPRAPAAAERLRDRLFAPLRCGPPAPSTGPRPSGSSGERRLAPADAACALLHLAVAGNDAELLALADAWAEAAGAMARIDARRAPSFRGAPGVHLTRARVAYARGDTRTVIDAARDLLDACARDHRDVTLARGHAGALLGCAGLLDLGSRLPRPVCDRVLAVGDELATRVGASVESAPARDGMARGLPGMLYAALRWSRATGRRVPTGIVTRLDALGARPRARRVPAGWSAGAAGLVYLWTEAAERLADARYTALARDAGLAAWRGRRLTADLAHGATGRAFALLRLYRHTGDACWRGRAEALTARLMRDATALATPGDGLFGGTLGLLVLDAELRAPEWSRFPMLEAPGQS